MKGNLTCSALRVEGMESAGASIGQKHEVGQITDAVPTPLGNVKERRKPGCDGTARRKGSGSKGFALLHAEKSPRSGKTESWGLKARIILDGQQGLAAREPIAFRRDVIHITDCRRRRLDT